MTNETYDFSNARRGAVRKPSPGKTRITIRIDDDILDWFRARAHAQGGGNYQTMMNNALREHIASQAENHSGEEQQLAATANQIKDLEESIKRDLKPLLTMLLLMSNNKPGTDMSDFFEGMRRDLQIDSRLREHREKLCREAEEDLSQWGLSSAGSK